MLNKLLAFYKEKDNKILVNNIAGTLLIKGIAMILTLFTMPVYIKYFEDKQAVGTWFSLVSVLNWILTFDLGIGNGLRNNLVSALSEKNDVLVKKLISSAYYFLGIVSLLLLVIGNICIGFIDVNGVFNISKDIFLPSVLRYCVRIVFSGIVLQFFLRIITSVLYAMRKTALSNLLTLISSASILLFVLIYQPEAMEDRLIVLSYAQVITTCLPLLITTIIIFMTVLKKNKPSVKSFDLTTGKQIMNLGVQFLSVQICLMIITSTNEILISRLSNVAFVVEYQAYYRVFYTVVTLFSLICQPMWSSFTQANVNKQYIWIKKTYRKFQLIAVGCSLLTVLLALVFDKIVVIWLGENVVQSSIVYSVTFSAFTIVSLLINTSSCLANGLNMLKCQVVWSIIGAILKIPLSMIFVKITGEWIGVVIANVTALLPLLFFQNLQNEKTLKKLNKSNNA